MNNLDLYEKFRAVPDNAKREIKGGKLNGKTDINPMWRIKVLTEAFGPCGIGWYYKLLNRWLEPGANGEIAAFVEIELYVKVNNEWSIPIFGTGGSMFVNTEKGQLVTNDEAYKMATTDAISVAAKQLGIGADVYWGGNETKYSRTSSPAPKANEKITMSDAVIVTPKTFAERVENARKEMEIKPTKAEKVKYFAAALGVKNSQLKPIVEKYAPDWKLEAMSAVAFNSTLAEIEETAERNESKAV